MTTELGLTGQRFNRWFVNNYNSEKSKEMGSPYYDCTCDCGTEKCVSENSLKRGKSKSCGCLQKEIVSEMNRNKRLDLTGQLFTRWRAININEEKTKETGYVHWNVICTNDGNKGCVRADSLRNGKSKSCGCLRKEKNSKANIGKKCNFWKGGITPENIRIRESTKCKNLTKQILKKANYICQISKEKSRNLQVHHIKGFAKILEENNITTKEQAFECKELWDEKNVIVLSEKWHMGIKTDNPNAFHRLYGNNNFTEEDFYNWFNKFSVIESEKE